MSEVEKLNLYVRMYREHVRMLNVKMRDMSKYPRWPLCYMIDCTESLWHEMLLMIPVEHYEQIEQLKQQLNIA
jgi:hypothetical protein